MAITTPGLTITVQSTTLITSWVTVWVSSNPAQLPPTTAISASSSGSLAGPEQSGTTTSHILEQASVRSISSSPQVSLPVVLSAAPPPSFPTTTLSLETQQAMSTPSSSSATSALSGSQKHAVIGGLSGAMAGLVMIGVLICFCLRRRRKRRLLGDESAAKTSIDQDTQPTITPEWMVGTPEPAPRPIREASPVSVDEDHHIIRLNLHSWPRPYAQGQGESIRDSIAPGQLRVVNPDSPRPATPRGSSDTAGSFLKRQRSALAAALLKPNRSRANSRSTVNAPYLKGPAPVPEITIDPALSRECVATTATTPSLRSYPSLATLPLVQQHALEDPFLAPPGATAEAVAGQRLPRLSLAPLQSAAARKLNHIGSALSPFRTKSSLAEVSRAPSRNSVSTVSSRLSGHTGTSDPFDLDHPSVRGSRGGPGRSMSEIGRYPQRDEAIYEGTWRGA